MAVVFFVLLLAVVLAAVGLQAAMFVMKRPFYGALSIGMLLGPATILAFAYAAVA